MNKNTYNIVAPICTVNEIVAVLQAGAGEIYFGIMPEKWIEKYGNSDFISRRQNEYAHISDYTDFSKIVRIVNDHGSTATLVLNSGYSENQMPDIFKILEEWETQGGHSVMVSDLEILLWLDSQNSKLKRQLSVMAGVFNNHSIDFFKQFNISRIVLPRELSIEEILNFIEYADKSLEYEIITMFQKCEYIDSFCRFYHSVNYRPFVVTNYSGSTENLSVISSYDPNYEGHGCQMEFFCKNRKINHLENNDMNTPFCAACSLETLFNAGIRNFKIAGRGYPPELIIKTIDFIKQTLEHSSLPPFNIKDNYKSVFGNECRSKYCYYQ